MTLRCDAQPSQLHQAWSLFLLQVHLLWCHLPPLQLLQDHTLVQTLHAEGLLPSEGLLPAQLMTAPPHRHSLVSQTSQPGLQRRALARVLSPYLAFLAKRLQSWVGVGETCWGAAQAQLS